MVSYRALQFPNLIHPHISLNCLPYIEQRKAFRILNAKQMNPFCQTADGEVTADIYRQVIETA